MRTQRDEPVGLDAIASLQHPRHCGPEVVVADPAGHTTEVLERGDMPCEERFLGLVAVGDVERLPATREPHHEHPYLHRDAGEEDLELAEVDLGLSTGRMLLADEDLSVHDPQLDPTQTHVARHAHLGHDRAVLGDQPLPDPPSSVSLLLRGLLVRDQPAIDDLPPRIDRRPRPRRIHLPRWRHRRGERLTHRAAVHPVSVRELTDRHLLVPPITADLLEQPHS